MALVTTTTQRENQKGIKGKLYKTNAKLQNIKHIHTHMNKKENSVDTTVLEAQVKSYINLSCQIVSHSIHLLK